jgi:outer membrane protein, multidrug efflux system
MTRSILLLAPVILAACATSQANLPGVNGNREEIFAVAPDAPADWVSLGVAGQVPTGDWLNQFDDPTMENLVREALANSPTLESRAALVRAAAASIRTARSQRLPSVDASVSTGVTSNAFEVGGDLDRSTDGIYGLGLDASWEADFWNRLGRGVAAAQADLAASEADFAAAELSVAAQTAIAWINLNAALAQERVAVLTYEARDRVRILTERRFQRGLAQALDVRTARSALAGAEAEIARRRQLSGEAARRLEILLGRYPATEIEATAELPVLESLSVEGNPMLLLSRRPDLASAEASIVAAGLRAEQARLAMLPALRLTGSISTSESEFADMVDPERIAARLVASLVQPLFTGGRLDAQRDAAVAQAEAAIASYAGAALNAWGEVEDAIAADTYLAQQEDAQLRALEEARLAEELAERQYTSGTITVFNLIDAQTRRLTSESQLVSARASRASNRISYHLALGGGLPVQTASTPPQAPQENAAE